MKTIVKRYYQIFRDGDYDASLFEIFPENRLNQQTIKQFSKADEIYLLNEKSNMVYIYKSELHNEKIHLAKYDFLYEYLFEPLTFRTKFFKYFEDNK